MSSDKDDSLEQLGFEILEASSSMRVVISKAASKAHKQFEPNKRGRLKAIMNRWCHGKGINEEMMNTNEGRTSRNNERLQAFKAFGVRLYGVEITFRRLRTFFIVDADPAKKQNKADPRVLERAKRRADDAIDAIKAKEKE